MWKFEKQFRKDNSQTIGETDRHYDLDNYKDWLESEIDNPIVRYDIYLKPIREGDKFKFKFMKELLNHIELTGSFKWNEDELRYEIDIIDNNEFVCLSYAGNGSMYGFKLI
jgi:hypothetical protein